VNASGNIVQIGSSSANGNAILFALNSYNGASDPSTTVNGSSYYSTVKGTSRCFENGYWSDCSTTKLQADTTLASAANSISLTLGGSTETSMSCRIDVSGRSANSQIYLRFNNASGATNYAYNLLNNLTGANNNTTSVSSAGAAQIQLTNTTSTNPGSHQIEITNMTTVNKSVTWTGVGSDAAAVPNNYKGSGTYFNATSRITSVQFLTSAGNFNSGTRAWCEAR
jgi:hypothetical protein